MKVCACALAVTVFVCASESIRVHVRHHRRFCGPQTHRATLGRKPAGTDTACRYRHRLAQGKIAGVTSSSRVASESAPPASRQAARSPSGIFLSLPPLPPSLPPSLPLPRPLSFPLPLPLSLSLSAKLPISRPLPSPPPPSPLLPLSNSVTLARPLSLSPPSPPHSLVHIQGHSVRDCLHISSSRLEISEISPAPGGPGAERAAAAGCAKGWRLWMRVRSATRVGVWVRACLPACLPVCVRMTPYVSVRACARACVRAYVCARMCVCARACVRASARALVRECGRACVRVSERLRLHVNLYVSPVSPVDPSRVSLVDPSRVFPVDPRRVSLVDPRLDRRRERMEGKPPPLPLSPYLSPSSRK